MSDKIDDGGPAFPQSDAPDLPGVCGGMSLRDWFAGQALMSQWGYYKDVEAAARLAFATADAMLRARKS